MKSDIEKIIDARVATAFGDLLPDPESRAKKRSSQGPCDLVRTVWIGKIYRALPNDETTILSTFSMLN